MKLKSLTPISILIVILVILAGCYYGIRLPQSVEISAIQSEGFGEIEVARPANVSMAALLFYSPDDKARVLKLGRKLARWGTITFSIDNSRFWAGLPSSAWCRFIGGDIERLGQALQVKVGLSTYYPPVFVGLNDSAMTAYSAYFHERHNVPAAVAWNVCSESFSRPKICPTAELTFTSHGAGVQIASSKAPLDEDFLVVGTTSSKTNCSGLVFSSEAPAEKTFEEVALHVADVAAEKFIARTSPMPIEELPATSGVAKYVAVFFSGDGGWAGLDQDTGKFLSQHDIGVIGVSGLKYFWNKRSPADTAVAVEKLFDQYGAKWNTTRFVLIGYSLGADAVPFIYNRLSDAMREKVMQVVSIAPERRCDFQVHISDWLGIDNDDTGDETLPEVLRIPPSRFLCLYAKDDETGICHDLDNSKYEVREFPGNHHFEGDYRGLGKAILDSLSQ